MISNFADWWTAAKGDLLGDAWDRTMQYDFAGRLTFNDFGMGRATDNQSDKRVYEQSIGLDAFSYMISREGRLWNLVSNVSVPEAKVHITEGFLKSVTIRTDQ